VAGLFQVRHLPARPYYLRLLNVRWHAILARHHAALQEHADYAGIAMRVAPLAQAWL
jgi:hypothetical protein